MNPEVSVILPVYNCEAYIGKSIQSLLDQEFKNFELIVLNDGSTDNTEEVLLSFNDNRIRYHRNENNLGIVGTLNLGVSMSTTNYIARMDADDVSYPQRLLLQYKFLEEHPDVAVCGAWLKIMDKDEYITYPETNDDIFYEFTVFNAIAHPVVMFRKDVWEKYDLRYEEEWFPAEDYMLWIQFAKHSKLHNLQLPLLDYRIHEASISVSKKEIQIERMACLRAHHMLDSLGLYSLESRSILQKAISFKFSEEMTYLLSLKEVFTSIVARNNTKNIFPKEKLNKVLSLFWYVATKKVKANKLKLLKIYLCAPGEIISLNYRLRLILAIFRKHNY